MRKFSKIFFVSTVSIFLLFSLANADAFNLNRPFTDFGSSGEPSLETIMDTMFVNDDLNVGDQSNAALWQQGDDIDMDAYLMTIIAGDRSGELLIYSDTGSYTLFERNASSGFDDTQVSFYIDSGDLYVENDLAVSGFGDTFGFAWQTDTTIGYTEDSLNTGGAGSENNIMALAYNLSDGTQIITTDANGIDFLYERSSFSVSGGNDWLLAFEDRYNLDDDFNDAIFLVEDLSTVPLPSAFILVGTGIVGLAVRRRVGKKA